MSVVRTEQGAAYSGHHMTKQYCLMLILPKESILPLFCIFFVGSNILLDFFAIYVMKPQRRFHQGVVTFGRGFKESAVVSLTVSRS